MTREKSEWDPPLEGVVQNKRRRRAATGVERRSDISGAVYGGSCDKLAAFGRYDICDMVQWNDMVPATHTDATAAEKNVVGRV